MYVCLHVNEIFQLVKGSERIVYTYAPYDICVVFNNDQKIVPNPICQLKLYDLRKEEGLLNILEGTTLMIPDALERSDSLQAFSFQAFYP